MRVPVTIHPYQQLELQIFWILTILTDVQKNVIIVLSCNSLMTNYVEHLLECVFFRLHIFFDKVSIQLIFTFSNGLLIFLFFGFLSISQIQFHYSVYILKICSPRQSFLFIPLTFFLFIPLTYLSQNISHEFY